MRNNTVSAAAEGMPTISRRALLAAVPAMGAVAIAPVMAEPVDPLLELITEYRRQVAIFAAIPDEVLTAENELGYVAATYEPSMNHLTDNTPQTTSLAGVRAAIRLAFQEQGFCCSISEAALRSALAYLDRRA